MMLGPDLDPGRQGIATSIERSESPLRTRLLELKRQFNEKLDRDNPGEWLSWWIAEDAFELPAPVIDKLRRGGEALEHFFRVANDLFYREPWIRRRLEKTISPLYPLLNDAQPNSVPVMPRPDVVLDRNWRPRFVELELTVCARFDTAVMHEQYGLDPNGGLIKAYADYFKSRWPGKTLALVTAPHPLWWYIVDEAIPFAARLKREGVDAVVLEGSDLPNLRFDGHQLVLCGRDGIDKPIHVFDRFIDIYELAELQHPGIVALVDAYAVGAVESINTCKQFLDEKDWMALFWDPRLRQAWHDGLGAEYDAVLRELIPRTWRLTPDTEVELPSGRTLPARALADLPVQERGFLIKESGTSLSASGAQSLAILSELESDEARTVLTERMDGHSPFVIQEIVESPRVSFTALNPNDNDAVVVQHGARMKFSVFYIAGRMTDIKFIASNAELAVNNRDCIEGIVRY